MKRYRSSCNNKALTSALLVGLLLGLASAGFAQGPQVHVPECAEGDGSDRDLDGLTDACEFALARSVAPLMIARSTDCEWDAASTPARIGGGYFHAVESVGSVIRIAYLPAYFRDCGWRGATCWLPWIDCSPHDGDSEFVVVELALTIEASFEITGLFLSAHCFGRTSGSCRWYRGNDLERFRWQGTSPEIWVAEGRHANYPSWTSCERGHHSIDTCSRHDVSYYFPVLADRNLGSRSHPLPASGCVSGRDLLTSRVDSTAQECFWRADASFGGWQAAARGVTPYDRYLRDIAEF